MLGGAPGQDNAIDSSRQDNTREEGSSFLSGSITGTLQTFSIDFMFTAFSYLLSLTYLGSTR